MASGDSIPVVDFAGLLSRDDLSRDDLSTCPQVQQLHHAFSQVGFVFIKNHGIDKKLIDDVFSLAMDFFNQPLEVKKRHMYHLSNVKRGKANSGYVAVEQESVDPSAPGDLKESFQVTTLEHNIFPDDEVPGFRTSLLSLYESGISFSRLLLELMGHALKLKDPRFFVKAHANAGHTDSYTTCRVLHYPPLSPTQAIKPGQLRCGEHVDYGSLSLLFQDPTGGLQVKRSGGGYIDVPFLPDVVLVNLGIQMQMWTGDTYLATPHRVLVPEEEPRRSRSRQSLVIFIHPDDDTVIESVHGGKQYPPTTAFDDTQNRLLKSYNY